MAGLDAFGTQLQRSDMATPTATFTAIANVTSITPPALARETLDTTTHGSPDGWREYIGGLKDGGEVSIDINYDPRLHDQLAADFGDANPRDYKVVWPGTLGSWSFAAVMTGFQPSAPHDDKLSATVTFQVSGEPTLTPGS
ncbi:phage tail tube protein [Streptomyces sp. B1866]|uniref:phage tail tube protein n=1 Tax=Streptomyces sp. B1866 TaxID=3075431 RepID=UPI00288FFCCB|nr:phage tail tube protein [Streptomyces sp. B1866]MDT3395433.1 phage tail tube protein [Streptomyces sp. B1866]